jgi:DNA-directed RNA polymerase I subunit RPA1
MKRSGDDVGTIEGGMASDYVAPQPEPSGGGDSGGLGDEDENDDGDGDGDAMGEEDGVTASRFGHRDEEIEYEPNDEEDEVVGAPGDAGSGDDDDDEDGTAPQVTDDDSDGAPPASFGSNTLKIDKRTNSFILLPLKVDPSARPLLMVGLVERAASQTLVRSRPKIQQAFVNEEDNGRGRCLQTAGVNFEELWKLDTVDHNRLASNDIWAICCAYGVEAARNNIVEQIQSVFGAYGISVDPRHLSLIADYMTFEGDFKAMNRGGMVDVGSSFLQMSFETTAGFMTEAANQGRKELLQSPSGNIVMGRPIRHGTGAFDLLAK